MSEYNGWKNYETWNVAFWIGNDDGLYYFAKECTGYKDFVSQMESCYDYNDESATRICYQTPNGVAWNDSGLDVAALDEMIAEL